MPGRGISLERSSQQREQVPRYGDVFRLRVDASAGVLMPTEIFAHQLRLVDPRTGQTSPEFCFVCSPIDLAVYPVSEPNPQQSPQYFRLPYVDILLPSEAVADGVWYNIRCDVDNLIAAYNRMDQLNESEYYRAGADDASLSLSYSYGSPNDPG